MPQPRKNNFPATVIIVIIFFGAIFLLSGLCTGFFMIEAERPNGGSYYLSHWYEAFLFGSITLIPSSLMLWAAIRQIRRGNNKVSGVIFVIAGILFGLYGLISLLSSMLQMTTVSSIGFSAARFGYFVGGLIFTLVVLFCAYWLLRVGLKIFQGKSITQINPETFD